jgi:hypothetical protein
MSTAQVVEDIVETSSNIAFYHSEEFWVSVAFVLVVFGLFVPVSKKIISMRNILTHNRHKINIQYILSRCYYGC